MMEPTEGILAVGGCSAVGLGWSLELDFKGGANAGEEGKGGKLSGRPSAPSSTGCDECCCCWGEEGE